MNAQAQHYAYKLAFEIDSWDLSVALAAGDAGGCNYKQCEKEESR